MLFATVSALIHMSDGGVSPWFKGIEFGTRCLFQYDCVLLPPLITICDRENALRQVFDTIQAREASQEACSLDSDGRSPSASRTGAQ